LLLSSIVLPVDQKLPYTIKKIAMTIYKYFSSAICAFILAWVLSACSNSYQGKSITRSSAFARTIERAKDNRYTIMHSGLEVYHITSVQMDRARQQMTVQLDKVDSLHLSNVKTSESRANTPKTGALGVTPEMHVYMKDSTSYTLDEPHTILLNKVARIEL
jgi:hypothetical protein